MNNTIKLPLTDDQLKVLIKEVIPTTERLIIDSLRDINESDPVDIIKNPKQFVEWSQTISEQLEFTNLFKSLYRDNFVTGGYVHIYHKDIEHLNTIITNYLLDDCGYNQTNINIAWSMIGLVQAVKFYNQQENQHV